jgi:hypothetical protein
MKDSNRMDCPARLGRVEKEIPEQKMMCFDRVIDFGGSERIMDPFPPGTGEIQTFQSMIFCNQFCQFQDAYETTRRMYSNSLNRHKKIDPDLSMLFETGDFIVGRQLKCSR